MNGKLGESNKSLNKTKTLKIEKNLRDWTLLNYDFTIFSFLDFVVTPLLFFDCKSFKI